MASTWRHVANDPSANQAWLAIAAELPVPPGPFAAVSVEAREAQTANAEQSASNVSTGSPLNFGELMQSLRSEEILEDSQTSQIAQTTIRRC
jgi:hypothetical protein